MNPETQETPGQNTPDIGAETLVKLREIELSQPTGVVDERGYVQVELPHGCNIKADFFEDQADIVGEMIPDPKLRGQGIGERMLQTMAAELAARGINEVNGNVQSKAALATRAKVFGADNLQIYRKNLRQGPTPLSYEQAMKELGAEFQSGSLKIVCRSDLSRVDTSQWERAELTPIRVGQQAA